LQEI